MVYGYTNSLVVVAVKGQVWLFIVTAGDQVHLDRPAAHRTIFDVALLLPATVIDPEADRLATIRASA
jgi:hypothetical protein